MKRYGPGRQGSASQLIDSLQRYNKELRRSRKEQRERQAVLAFQSVFGFGFIV